MAVFQVLPPEAPLETRVGAIPLMMVVAAVVIFMLLWILRVAQGDGSNWNNDSGEDLAISKCSWPLYLQNRAIDFFYV